MGVEQDGSVPIKGLYPAAAPGPQSHRPTAELLQSKHSSCGAVQLNGEGEANPSLAPPSFSQILFCSFFCCWMEDTCLLMPPHHRYSEGPKLPLPKLRVQPPKKSKTR